MLRITTDSSSFPTRPSPIGRRRSMNGSNRNNFQARTSPVASPTATALLTFFQSHSNNMSEPSFGKCRTTLDNTESALEHPPNLSGAGLAFSSRLALAPPLHRLSRRPSITMWTYNASQPIPRTSLAIAAFQIRSCARPPEMGSPIGCVGNPGGFNACASSCEELPNPRPRHHGLKRLRHQHSEVATCRPYFNHLNTPQSRSPSAAAHINGTFNSELC